MIPAVTSSVLEIGAGTGSTGALLARRFRYVGLEPDRTSFEVAVRRVGLEGLVLNMPVEDFTPDELFDVVCAFEVLEHLDDDRGSLRVWLRHLRPGGHLLVSVPFGRRHFGPWDVKAGHFRRYDRADLEDALREAGLGDVLTVAYGFPLGSAASLVRDLIARFERSDATPRERTAGSARNLQPPVWAAHVTRAVAAPFRVAQRPFSQTRVGPGIVGRGSLLE